MAGLAAAVREELALAWEGAMAHPPDADVFPDYVDFKICWLGIQWALEVLGRVAERQEGCQGRVCDG
jgi:hypothetical protein